MFNNTIVDNDAALGAGIYASGDNQQVTITNNIIVESDNQTALYCTNLRGSLIPLISFNNVFAPQGTPYGSQCSNQTGINGNISAVPLFMSATGQDYRLQSTSPSVDSGDNGATGPFYNIDILGNPRFVDGNGDGTVVIDMGAYEFGERIPLANAGPDQTVSCDSNCKAAITLDGRGSSDPDGNALTYIWTGPFGTATGPTPVVTLSKGQHPIILTVNDGKGGAASDTVLITVVDRTAPSLVSITASPKILSPAKHQMVPITVVVSARDNCDPSVSCRITSVTSNEPVNGLGDGDKSPDWTITGPLTVSLRAERAAKGNGRIYTINIDCVDSSGNRATSYVQVSSSVKYDRYGKGLLTARIGVVTEARFFSSSASAQRDSSPARSALNCALNYSSVMRPLAISSFASASVIARVLTMSSSSETQSLLDCSATIAPFAVDFRETYHTCGGDACPAVVAPNVAL